jgi:HlyD family secretion protein
VLRVSQESESIVAAGAPLLTIGDPSTLEIVADFRSDDAVRMRAGMPAVIESWGGSPLPARVERIEPAAYTKVSALGIEEQRTKVLLKLMRPPPEALRAQDFRIDARVTLDARRNVLRIPQAALFRSGEKWRAFRIEKGRARSVEVTVGVGDGNEREVLHGLALGDRVVLYPRPDLVDGVRVR